MESQVAESTQQMLLPGKCVDLYYPDPETAQKQCYRTTVNTKYVVGFNTLTAGVNVLTIPPNNGVSDICVVLNITAPTTTTNCALPQGWGYNLIRRLSYRVGGSSQYFVSGSQNLQNTLRQAPDAAARNALFALGGPAITTSADWTNPNNLVAYVYLSMPWSRPSSVSKPSPLSTDLLTQQVQIQLEINNFPSIISLNGGSVAGAALNQGQFQVGQVQFANQGDALARRVDMTLHSLSHPVEFVQQEFTISLPNASTNQVVTSSLTGFRSGEVKNIQCWLSIDSDATTGGVQNLNRWLAPTNVIMTYAGDQYARFDNGSSQLWNLINNRMTPSASAVANKVVGGVITAPVPEQINWLELPFAQTYNADTAHSMYVSGREITNGIVQVQYTIPTNLDGSAISSANMTLHVSYIYNSVLVFSQGTADFAF